MDVEKLAAAHWAYVEQVIRNEWEHRDCQTMDESDYCARVGMQYKSAFIHGFKHGQEYELKRPDWVEPEGKAWVEPVEDKRCKNCAWQPEDNRCDCPNPCRNKCEWEPRDKAVETGTMLKAEWPAEAKVCPTCDAWITGHLFPSCVDGKTMRVNVAEPPVCWHRKGVK